MIAGILSIGSEIMTGRTVDTNSAWLCRSLFRAGIPVRRISACDDCIEEISASFRALIEECDIVISTGGLGPTFDDLTRDALAMATGRECVENSDALGQVESFFRHLNRTMTSANRCQARMPSGSRVIPNHRGSAPGIHLEHSGRSVFCLPGVPGEMKAMYEEYVSRNIECSSDTNVASLHFFGVPEAEIAGTLDGLAVASGISRSINAGGGVITVWLWGADTSFRSESERIENALLATFGSALFGKGDDTLAGVVHQLAEKHTATIGTVESCTGGLVAKLLTDIPGASMYYKGSVVSYANEIKTLLGVPEDLIERHGAVSEEVAREMASCGRRWLNVDYAVSVTGIAGPSGGTEAKKVGTICSAVASANCTHVKHRIYNGTRDMNRVFFANFALNSLRLAMLENLT